MGLCLERSAELVVGILGILKAGGAYVPLDADYPPAAAGVHAGGCERGVSGHPAIAARSSSGKRLPGRLSGYRRKRRAATLRRDRIRAVERRCGQPRLRDLHLRIDRTPKGVAIEHRSIARLVFGNDYAAFGPDRVFLQLATASFDASTLELWGALLHGAKLVVCSGRRARTSGNWKHLLQRHRVTTLWLTVNAVRTSWSNSTPRRLQRR